MKCWAGIEGCGILFDEHGHLEPAPTAEPPKPEDRAAQEWDEMREAAKAKPEPPAPSPDLDPFETALRKIEEEHRGVRNGGPFLCPICHHNGGFLHANSPCEVLHMIAALRVLKRGHFPTGDAFGRTLCWCRKAWPCPELDDAAAALRGESK